MLSCFSLCFAQQFLVGLLFTAMFQAFFMSWMGVFPLFLLVHLSY